MVDDITKILRKESVKDRSKILNILQKIKNKDLSGLDIKKLSGKENEFRVRSGRYRICFENIKNKLRIKWVKRRNNRTY